jgi:ATP-dependent protease HslVU (ClpYQ) ATPase subunit|tara:strand:- start:104 stop:442 length:339 start_codon:yes stop_codon:yes gene_type:complete
VNFIKQLDEVRHATKKQINEEHWHVEGIIKSKSNQKFKFDLSPIIKFEENDYGKVGYFNSKSDKIVFDFKENWILIDTEELIEYVKETQKKDIDLNDLLDDLSWNIILSKIE